MNSRFTDERKTEYDDLDPVLTCQKCGSEDLEETITDRIDVGVGLGIPCEMEYSCIQCGTGVNYWAYGNWSVYHGQIREQEQKQEVVEEKRPLSNFWDKYSD